MDIITPDQVKNFVISDLCAETHPCQHQCVVVLEDGRKWEVELNGYEINALIQEIAPSKIVISAHSSDHFRRYEILIIHPALNRIKISATQILSSLAEFAKKSRG